MRAFCFHRAVFDSVRQLIRLHSWLNCEILRCLDHTPAIVLLKYTAPWIINQSIKHWWSLFGPTRKSSPWGNFPDGGLDQSIKRWLLLWNFTWLVYWIRTARSVFTGAGLKWPNIAGQYTTYCTPIKRRHCTSRKAKKKIVRHCRIQSIQSLRAKWDPVKETDWRGWICPDFFVSLKAIRANWDSTGALRKGTLDLSDQLGSAGVTCLHGIVVGGFFHPKCVFKSRKVKKRRKEEKPAIETHEIWSFVNLTELINTPTLGEQCRWKMQHGRGENGSPYIPCGV